MFDNEIMELISEFNSMLVNFRLYSPPFFFASRWTDSFLDGHGSFFFSRDEAFAGPYG